MRSLGRDEVERVKVVGYTVYCEIWIRHLHERGHGRRFGL